MKKILIICQHFVPYTPSVGGVVRVASLVRFLSARGYEVFVLTSDGVDFGYLGYEDIQDLAEIRYLPDLLKKIMQQGVKLQKSNIKNSKPSLLGRALPTFKKIIYEIMVPDSGILMVNAYKKAASELITEHRIKNVLISSPPHSMQLVGLWLKKQFGSNISLIVDYRDSWNMTTIFRKKLWPMNAISMWMEKRVLSSCDYFTYVSSSILDKLNRAYPINLPQKAVLVMNGYEQMPAFKEKSASNGIVTIGYFGMLDDIGGSYRNIGNLLNALTLLGDDAKKFRIELFGHTKLTNFDLSLFPCVSLNENVSHQTALDKMQEMDFLMIIHADKKNCDEVITGKFFDYLVAKRPMLCLAPPEMEARKLIEKHGLGVCADIDSTTDVAEKLRSLIDFEHSEFQPDIDIKQFHRSVQYEKIISLLHK